MKKKGILIFAIWLLIQSLSACTPNTSPVEGAKMVTQAVIYDAETVLHNPDMGWVLQENHIVNRGQSNLDLYSSTGYDFPGVDYVGVMVSWADIEKSENNYDFTELDFVYDVWTRLGKQVIMRLGTEFLYGADGGWGIPQYVLDGIPKELRATRMCGSTQYKVVDQRNEYYQTRLRAFLEAFNAHYSKEEGRPIDYLDLRGFGCWGEWHSGYPYETIEDRREALFDVLDIWSVSFPDKWLFMSYSYDPDEPSKNYYNTNFYDDYVYWSAFDYAMTLPNVTLRRDGAGGAVYQNERTLCDLWFTTRENPGPFYTESWLSYEDDKNRAVGVEYTINDEISLHSNFATLPGWCWQMAWQFMKEEPDLFEYALLNFGYRLTVTEASILDQVRPGGQIDASFIWQNHGCGHVVEDYSVRLVLSNDQGTYEVDLGKSGCKTWIKDQDYSLQMTGTVPLDCKPGKYDVYLTMYSAKREKYIGLAIDAEKLEDYPAYKVGSVEIV